RVRFEAADVAPPCEKCCQAVAEGAVEDGRIALLFRAPHRRLRRTASSVIISAASISGREPEMQHVAIRDNVVLAFEAEFAGLPCSRVAVKGDIIGISD